MRRARRLAQSVKVMIALAIFLTYALQFYVPMEIIRKGFIDVHLRKHPVASEYVLRVALVLLTGKCLYLEVFPPPTLAAC